MASLSVREPDVTGTTSAPNLQPIAARIVMLQSGMRAPMGVKVQGPDLETIEKLRFILNRKIETALAPKGAITGAINRYYGQVEGESADSMLQEFTDTAIDFTEQGGLIWRNTAVGKLIRGADALKPTVKAFVDDEAGADVAEKVTRRLQHFIDRKIAAGFEPLLNLSRDEALTGLARGFAFQMVEGLGILPRASVANEVKALDQDARSALRKHGIRFGQFTIFQPLLLKPAPTRLRLVLWSLAQDLAEFPESPPAGLVTVPNMSAQPAGTDTMAGYRNAGTRAIRIDMLERLADMLRSEDSRGGFEAKADMLSITGMTLEQFADLMAGLGYKADKGERVKVKAAPAEAQAAPQATEAATEAATEVATEETAPLEAAVEAPVEAETPTPAAPEAKAEDAPEMEVFYTFTWGGNRGNARPRGKPAGQGDAPRGKGKPQRKGKPQGKDRGKPQGAQSYQARPPKEKAIDPDNPFAAALMGLTKKD